MKTDITKEMLKNPSGRLMIVLLIEKKLVENEGLYERIVSHSVYGGMPREAISIILIKMVEDGLLRVYEEDGDFVIEPVFNTANEAVNFFSNLN